MYEEGVWRGEVNGEGGEKRGHEWDSVHRNGRRELR